MKAPTPTWFWPVTALGFVLLVIGAAVAVDVQKVVGIVLVCVAAAIFLFLKQARYSQLARARRAGR